MQNGINNNWERKIKARCTVVIYDQHIGLKNTHVTNPPNHPVHCECIIFQHLK